MQRWAKFQFQSRVLNTKVVFFVLTVGLFIIFPESFAQDESDSDEKQGINMFHRFSVDEKNDRLGEIIEIPLRQQTIRFEFTTDSDVKVTHVIKDEHWNENNPRMIKILSGDHSNLRVTDIDRDYYIYSWDNETFEKSEYVILQLKLRSVDLLVEYELKNYLEQDENLWEKEIQMPTDVEMIFDDEIDIIFTNSRPIDLSESDGILCVGCNMQLEFFDNINVITEKIISNGNEKEIKIWSNGEISNIQFNDSIRELYFKTEINNQLVVIDIPTELLLYPFEVYLTENDDNVLDQEDKIRNTEFAQSIESSKISIRPLVDGNVSIVGATQEVHEQMLSKIEQRNVVEEVEVEVEVEEIDNKTITEVYEEWGGSKNNNDSEGNLTIILVIVLLIIAIIIGVILKIKKN